MLGVLLGKALEESKATITGAHIGARAALRAAYIGAAAVLLAAGIPLIISLWPKPGRLRRYLSNR